MAEEIELKLAAAPADLRRLARSPALRPLKAGPARTRRLSSTYFDTPALTLMQHGMALRVRRDGNARVQTLKAPLNAAGQAAGDGLQHLREFEAPLEQDTPDLSLIDDADLQAFFAREDLARELEAVFTTEFERRSLPLALADSRIELALDSGCIVSGESEIPLSEAELELESGPPARLYELALLLNRAVPLRLERESKAERGYRLYAEGAPTPQKAAKPKLSRRMTVAEAFTTLARSCLWQMRANEAAVLDGRDPEGVHQMRVAIRRLRALVAAFQPAFAETPLAMLKAELRWLQKQLGPARDWDVFLTETLPPVRRRLPSAAGLDLLADTAEDLRRESYAAARATLHDPRYTALLLHLSLWLVDGGWRPAADDDGAAAELGDAPVAPFACALLNRQAKKVRKLGKRRNALSESDLHRLRIRAKKLRYSGEFFAGLFPKKAVKPYLKRLEVMQDGLGALNDAVTGQRLLDDLDARLPPADGQADGQADVQPDGDDTATAAAQGAGILLGWQAARMDRAIADFDGVWGRFEKMKGFWRRG